MNRFKKIVTYRYKEHDNNNQAKVMTSRSKTTATRGKWLLCQLENFFVSLRQSSEISEERTSPPLTASHDCPDCHRGGRELLNALIGHGFPALLHVEKLLTRLLVHG